MKYSGRTTAYKHKFSDWESHGKNIGKDCIQNKIIFEVQWSNCPVEVEKEVKEMWRNYEAGNGHWYLSWEGEEMCEDYPVIHEYLSSRGITECLIHWWW